MRCAWLLLALSACASAPVTQAARPSGTEPESASHAPSDVVSVVARIAYVHGGTVGNWLEIQITGPSDEAMRACQRLVAAEVDHAPPTGFTESVQRPCSAAPTDDRAALSPLPYELVDSEPVTTDVALASARYAWVERFAQPSECEAARAAHLERRERERIEMRNALGATATAPSSSSRDGGASALSCRKVVAR